MWQCSKATSSPVPKKHSWQCPEDHNRCGESNRGLARQASNPCTFPSTPKECIIKHELVLLFFPFWCEGEGKAQTTLDCVPTVLFQTVLKEQGAGD